ncbi:uncharacterized protein KY384_005853 [Bacidia gigantensis]|uniref:uncharacterized protein n=1 Tax=Bacidia gigantensis TaxID=2732470 RepID=UPI001D0471DC|nr:uncharacterized protein KY384_005853 [Bacidia gigantensis]KAG8529218.1 hypothetical protein KY384_005853 [Bacidia gigantensis]
MAGLAAEGRALEKPMNVEEIILKAEQFDYNPHIEFKYYLRTANTLLKEADIYEQEGNDQQTFFLLYRHAQLVIVKLSNSLSPDARQPANKTALNVAIKQANQNLQKLEVLKPNINKYYERYEKLKHERDARRASAVAAPQNSRASTPVSHKRALSDHYGDGTVTETIAAGENRELAVKLAQREIKRRATARKATRQAGISEEVEHERRSAGGLWGDWEDALTKDDNKLDKDTLSQQIQGVRSQIQGSIKGNASRRERPPTFEGLKSKYFQYPAVPERKLSTDDRSATISSGNLASERPNSLHSSSLRNHASQLPPQPPPKDPETFLFDETPTPPERPEKLLSYTNSDDDGIPESPAQRPDPKPSEFTFKPSAHLENGTPLRTIFLPPDLQRTFLSIAQANTSANLETCGILCGTLISNALFISKLVIPDQESTSDTCETVNESELFDYVDGEDLLVLGWIHTHPTQTCFMSSRDLHTHGGYQVMLPESIAIVCAPSKDEWGVFRLTDPPGMKTILNCTQTGLFHPHAESNIYTDALRPGHVFEAQGLEFDIVDLRPR